MPDGALQRPTRATAPAAPAQVLLRWGLQQGCAVIPKSIRAERIAEASPSKILEGWELSNAQVAALSGLDNNHKFCWNPEGIA
jgi:diketogulonate reductase-like aldo/keto reductase